MFRKIDKPQLPTGTILDTDLGLYFIENKLGEGNFSQAYDLEGEPNLVAIIASKEPKYGYENDYAKEILADYSFEFINDRWLPYIRYAGEIDPLNQVFISRRYYFGEQYFTKAQRLTQEMLKTLWWKAMRDALNYNNKRIKWTDKQRQIFAQRRQGPETSMDYQMTPAGNKLVRKRFLQMATKFSIKAKDFKPDWQLGGKTALFTTKGLIGEEINHVLREEDWTVYDQDVWNAIVQKLKHFDAWVNKNHPNFIIDYDFNQYNVAKTDTTKSSLMVFPDLIHAHPYEKGVAVFDTKGVYDFPHR